MDEMQRLSAEVQGLRHAVFGNGKRGLVVQVEDLAEHQREAGVTLDAVAASVKSLADEAASERLMREGSRRTLRQIRAVALAILGLLAAGGATVFTSLRSLVNDLSVLLP